MRRYLEIKSAPALLQRLREEGVLTKIQHRVSGPHRGGIPFARGSLFYLLKNPVYRGKLVHKGQIYEGEHPAVVDEELWQAVQTQLKEKAPPRKRATNEPQNALLQGLLTDPEGRPVVPTYTSMKSGRRAYYETRKDIARRDDRPATRFSRGSLEKHLLEHLIALLDDQHGLRRLCGMEIAAQLRTIFEMAQRLGEKLRRLDEVRETFRSLVAATHIRKNDIDVAIRADAFGPDFEDRWHIQFPLPARKPFREAKLRIDATDEAVQPDRPLLILLSDAFEAQRLVLAFPELSLNALAKREGRCRTQLAKLLRISWLSPRIIEAIADGVQPKTLTRKSLLVQDIPIDWAAQERLFGLAQ
jgi:hypothetical protein